MLEPLLDKVEEKKEAAERRRAELISAFERGDVAEPVTGVIFTIAVLKAVLISTAFSIGTALLTRALTPRQKFTTGQLQGTLQIPQSDQGLPIVEGYGADPASRATAFRPSHAYALEDRVVSGGYFYVVTTAGTSGSSAPTFPETKYASVTSGSVTFTNYGRTGGGFRLPMLIVYASNLRKHEEIVEGNGGGKGGPEAPEQTVVTYDLDFAVMPGRGPLNVKRLRANTKTIYQNYLAPTSVYEAEDGDNTLTNAGVITTSYASGGQTVQMNTSTGAVQFNDVLGAGSSTQVGIGYVASGARTCQIWVNGSLATTVTLPGNDPSLRWHVATVNIPETAGNVVKLVNTSSAGGAILYLDRISVGGVATPTGVPDPFIPADVPYDPNEPFSPNEPYEVPTARYSAALAQDVDGSLAGTVQAGSYAGIAIYPGNDSQLPDPTIQAAIDGLYGADSTPAFRGRCLIVLTNFYLTDYGGAIPLIQTLAEHQTIDTFEAFGAHMCDRTGVLESADYDFSGVRRLFLRGFPVTPPFAPADVLEELARVYNVYFVESDKIYAYERGSQEPVATLSSADLGWVDGDADDDEGELAALDFDLAPETEVSRRYELTYVDPGRDFEQNSQGTSRQITRSEKTEKIELALTMHPEEAREVTQRELYEEEVESTKHRLDLDWTYLWLEPGMSIIVNETDGTTSRIFIETFRPNVGVCPVEGFAEELAVYSQPVSTSGGGAFEIPPVPIPAMTIVSFYDGPPLRTEDEGKSGFYAWAVKRAGDGAWRGATLVKMVEGEPQTIAQFEAQAAAGKVVTKLGTVADTDTEDTSRACTVDPATDTVTLTAHGFEADETVGIFSYGTIPGGLDSTELYFARDVTANTLKLALTAGGSAVDITSAGSGTHAIQRVIEVDLQDESALLASVTSDQIAEGANPCLIGNEVVQVRTWELVAGHRRRFRGRDFTRGLRGSEPFVGLHTAGERFVALNSAVKFVAQDIGELNAEREYRAPTAGQSLDDAAAVDFAWTGGTLKYPAPSVFATLDSDGVWRFRLYGVDTNDPEGERYNFEIVDGRSFVLRGGVSRPVSLSDTSALPGDNPIPPVAKGQQVFVEAPLPGNALTGAGYAVQMVEGERTAVSATYQTDLTAESVTGDNSSILGFTPGPAHSVALTINAQTSSEAASLTIFDNHYGIVFTDTAGEATGTRYTVEFRDGKMFFYRNRHAHGAPFFVHPLLALADPGDSFFPAEFRISAGADTAWSDIEIDDMGAALIYTVAEQEEDGFTVPTGLTIRASQQRVVGGVVVDGQVVEATYT